MKCYWNKKRAVRFPSPAIIYKFKKYIYSSQFANYIGSSWEVAPTWYNPSLSSPQTTTLKKKSRTFRWGGKNRIGWTLSLKLYISYMKLRERVWMLSEVFIGSIKISLCRLLLLLIESILSKTLINSLILIFFFMFPGRGDQRGRVWPGTGGGRGGGRPSVRRGEPDRFLPGGHQGGDWGGIQETDGCPRQEQSWFSCVWGQWK